MTSSDDPFEIVVFLGPYLLWAALRAANHAWSTPTVGKSILDFFFGSGIPFAIYTAWMLLLVWIWAITVAAGTEPAEPGLDFKRLRFALLQS